MDSDQSQPGSGSNSGSFTREHIGNSPPPHVDNVDDINITGLSTPSKSNQTKPSLQDSAISPLSSWKKLEVHLLEDIIDFHKKNGTYPFDDSDAMHKFYNQWNETYGFYKDEDELNNKMVELHERFMMNFRKLVSGDVIEDGMDPIESRIYWL